MTFHASLTAASPARTATIAQPVARRPVIRAIRRGIADASGSRAALLSHEGAARAAMGAELAVWQLRRWIVSPQSPAAWATVPFTSSLRGGRDRA